MSQSRHDRSIRQVLNNSVLYALQWFNPKTQMWNTEAANLKYTDAIDAYYRAATAQDDFELRLLPMSCVLDSHADRQIQEG